MSVGVCKHKQDCVCVWASTRMGEKVCVCVCVCVCTCSSVALSPEYSADDRRGESRALEQSGDLSRAHLRSVWR